MLESSPPFGLKLLELLLRALCSGISDQPDYKGTPVEQNVLLSALEKKFNSGGHTLNTFMRDWLETDLEAASLYLCRCFSKIVDHYELEISVSDSI